MKPLEKKIDKVSDYIKLNYTKDSSFENWIIYKKK